MKRRKIVSILVIVFLFMFPMGTEGVIARAESDFNSKSADVTTQGIDSSGLTTLNLKAAYEQTSARSILDMINTLRTGSDAWYWNENNTQKIQKNDLVPLVYDYQLEKVAMKRAAEIAFYYAHIRPDGTECWTAYNEVPGVGGGYMAENIAFGQNSAEDVNKAWREDNDHYSGQGHRRNMLNESLTTVGIGHAIVNGVHCWVEDFGSKPADTSPSVVDTSERVVAIQARNSFISRYALLMKEGDTSLSCGDTLNLAGIGVSVQSTGSYSKPVPIDTPVTWTVTGSNVSSDGVTLTASTAGEFTLTGAFSGTTQSVTGTVNHKPEIDPEVEATYFSDGLTEGSHCSGCHAVIVAQETIPKLVLGDTAITRLVISGKKAASVTLSETEDASGYRIQYSMSKSFSSGVKEKNISGTSCRIKGLIKKKTYYFRAMAFVTDGENTSYGNWSPVRKIKVK